MPGGAAADDQSMSPPRARTPACRHYAAQLTASPAVDVATRAPPAACADINIIAAESNGSHFRARPQPPRRIAAAADIILADGQRRRRL